MICSLIGRALVVIVFVQVFFAASARCQEQQYANIGDLHLQNGQVIKNCRVGYRTYGKLNKNHSNGILWPTWFLGRSGDLSPMIGPNRLLDTERFFVVTVDALGDGVSSSPSNSPEQPGMAFPEFTILDMVNSQYALLTQKLGISHLHAVLGQSMGAFQAFQWIVSYPDFMDRMISVMGTPRVSTSDALWLSVEAESIRNDTAWDGGNYKQQPKLLAARYMQALVMTSPNQMDTIVPPDQTAQYIAQISGGGNFDANDWLYQLDAILKMNIFQGRSMKDTAKLVKSKVLIINGTQDHAVNWEEPAKFAQALGVKPVLLDSPCGHGAASCEAATLTPVIGDFLR